MDNRIDPQTAFTLQPALSRALISLGEACSESLPSKLTELVKIRCSQINKCAYCLDMHLKEARQQGEGQQRLDTLVAWRETGFFSPEERAVLAFCEALTSLNDHRIDDKLYESLKRHFDEKQIVDLTTLIVVINGWNRVVASLLFQPSTTN